MVTLGGLALILLQTEILAASALMVVPGGWLRAQPALALVLARALGLALFAVLAAALAATGLGEQAATGGAHPADLAFAALALTAGVALWHRRRLLKGVVRGAWPGWLMLLAATTLYAPLFAWNSELIVQSERPVDLSFMAHLSMVPVWPPMDPWMAGEPLNYYHFGFWTWGMLLRLSPLSLEAFFVAATLAVWARLAEAVLALGAGAVTARQPARDRPARDRPARAWGAWAWGLGAVVLILVAGNFDGLAHVIETGRAEVDWWRASRVIPGTITETPWFAALHGDLHPYLLAMPISLGVLALILLEWPRRRQPRAVPLLLGLMLGVLWPTHSWNTVMLGAVLAGLAVVRILHPAGLGRLTVRHWRVAQALGWAAGLTLAVPVAMALSGGFDQGGRPLGWVQAEHRSGPWALLIVLGPPFGVAVVAALLAPGRAGQRRLRMVAAVVLGGVAGIGGALASAQLPLVAIVTAGLVAATRRALRSPVVLAALLVMAGSAGIIATELVFVEDYYVGADDRLNTVFKVHFLAWFLIGLGAVGLAAAARPRWLMLGLGAAAVGAGLIYTVLAPASRALVRHSVLDPLRGQPVSLPPALELVVQGDTRQAMREAAQFLRETFRHRPLTLMEGVDWGPWRDEPPDVRGNYIWAGMVTVMSGHRAVLVWPMHEAGWRPEESFPPAPRDDGSETPAEGAALGVGGVGDRAPPAPPVPSPLHQRWQDVRTFYQTDDPALADAILERYGVDVVVYGPMERDAYPGAAARLARLPVLYRNRHVVLYQARPNRSASPDRGVPEP